MTIHSGGNNDNNSSTGSSTMPTAPSRPSKPSPPGTAPRTNSSNATMGAIKGNMNKCAVTTTSSSSTATLPTGPPQQQRPRAASESDMDKAEAARRKAAAASRNYPAKVNVFQSLDTTPRRFTSALCPVNLLEQKEKFLQYGIIPKFVMRASSDKLEKITQRDRGQIRFNYLPEAKMIIQAVKKKYGDGSAFIEQMFGNRVDEEYASSILDQYLTEHNLQGQMSIYWTPDLSCTAKMMWHGPSQRFNKPEARKFSLLMKSSNENNFMRDVGITCLANHEIGTHYFRMINDGLQPWYSDRSKFQLKQMSCREFASSEEGLATVNTILQARVKLLWTSALLYYTACMAAEMTFRELFDHLAEYMSDKEQRWKHVMRVKRGLRDASGQGGYGNDQCYFEGAVEILRNIDSIDFRVLYSGRVCVDELNRVRRLARLECIKLPMFMRDLEKYKRTLRHIAVINGLIPRPTARGGGGRSRKGAGGRQQGNNNNRGVTGKPPIQRAQTQRNLVGASSQDNNNNNVPGSHSRIKLLHTMPYSRAGAMANYNNGKSSSEYHHQQQQQQHTASLGSMTSPSAAATATSDSAVGAQPLPDILSGRDSTSDTSCRVLTSASGLALTLQHSLIKEPGVVAPQARTNKKLVKKLTTSKEDLSWSGYSQQQEDFGLLSRSEQF